MKKEKRYDQPIKQICLITSVSGLLEWKIQIITQKACSV